MKININRYNHIKKSTRTIEIDIDRLSKRFWKHVIKSETNDCLIWAGAKNKKGYGVMNSGHKFDAIQAHRASWLIKYHELSAIDLILHRCDNTSCVNIDHLWKGTAQQNTDDMMKKGRCRSPGHFTSDKNPNRKLNKEQIIEIKKMLSKGNLSQMQIAKIYGVSNYAICDIKRGHSWSHIKLEDENV